MITHEEALAKVKRYLTDYLPSDKIDEIDEIINALESPKWIPVNKELPKQSGWYWCTLDGKERFVDRAIYITESGAKIINDEEPEDYIGWQSENVIAWTEKIEPYKAKNEG